MMQDPLRYTEQELVKELVLLEKHLKQSPYMDEDFCIDCIEKHVVAIEGLSEEGIGFADDKEKEKMFIKIANETNRLKKEIKINPDFVDLSRRVREIRKDLNNCSTCNIPRNLPKDLNNRASKNKNNTNNLNKNQKGGISMKIKDIGVINAGAFVGKGIQVGADWIDTKMPVDPLVPREWYSKPSTYINIGGGLALQLLALYAIKNHDLKLMTVVAGSNMTTKAVDIAKEALTPAATLRAPVRAQAARAQVARARAAPLRVTPAIAPITPRGNGLVVVD